MALNGEEMKVKLVKYNNKEKVFAKLELIEALILDIKENKKKKQQQVAVVA
jgi:hypothetical protein